MFSPFSSSLAESLLYAGWVPTLLVAGGWLLQRFIRSGVGQRTLWRATIVVVLAAVVCELGGVNVALRAALDRWLPHRPIAAGTVASVPASPGPSDVNVTAPAAGLATQPMQPGADTTWHTPHSELSMDVFAAKPLAAHTSSIPFASDGPSDDSLQATWQIERSDAAAEQPIEVVSLVTSGGGLDLLQFTGFVWILGALIFLGRHVARCLCLARLCRRARPVGDREILSQVESISVRLRAPRIRILQSEDVATPMACGVLRPTLLLPASFKKTFTPSERAAILAHEVMHLASGDPRWLTLSVCSTGCLWWHPAVWFAAGRHRLAMEFAADEAANLLPEGPCELAECLLRLGRELSRKPSWGIGMAGPTFRSALAVRVERLLQMRRNPGRGSHVQRSLSGIVQTTLIVVLFLMSLAVGIALPREAPPFPANGDSEMQLVSRSLRNSVAATVVSGMLSPLALAQDVDVSAEPDAAAESAVERVHESAVEGDVFGEGGDDPFVGNPFDNERDGDPFGDDATPRRERRRERRRQPEREGRPHEIREHESRVEGPEHRFVEEAMKAIERHLKTLPREEDFDSVRGQLEQEIRRLREQLAAAAKRQQEQFRRHQRNFTGQRQQFAKRRRDHLMAAIENLRAAGLNEHAERVELELEAMGNSWVPQAREPRFQPPRGPAWPSSPPRLNAPHSPSPGSNPYPSAAPQAIAVPAPVQVPHVRPAGPEVESLKNQVAELHEQMREMRRLLSRLADRDQDQD